MSPRWPEFLILVLSAIGTGWPQAIPATPLAESASPDATTTTLRSTTRTVVLDVIVTGENGRPLDGLSKSDFVLDEDGKPQTIVTFDSHGSRDADAHSAPAQNILLLDEINNNFSDLGFARNCLHKLVKKYGANLEQPTSLMVLGNRGLVVLREPTRDGNALIAALDRHIPDLPVDLQLAGTEHDSHRIQVSLAALQKIAMAGAGSSVRRNLIWISPGFPCCPTST